MKGLFLSVGAAALAVGVSAGVVLAQAPAPAPAPGAAPAAPPPPPRPYYVGNALGLPIAPPAPDAQNPAAYAAMSSNVKVYGAIYSTESCTYDPDRDLIVAPARGVGQAIRANDAFVALINHDGSVHTARWIGVQNPGAQRDNMDPPLVLNEPFGSYIRDGILYLADRDGGTPDPANPGQNVPGVSVIRMFNMADGTPAGEIRVPESTGFNDITVAADGTIYASQTGMALNDQNPNAATSWRIFKITPDGTATVFIEGEPLRQPNGVEVDNDGNIVVVNIGNADVLTFNPAGELILTEQAVQGGNDGLVILADGTKYVSSVTMGGVSMIPPGGTATLIAENIPSAASMCYDAGANQLVIPMNANNALAFVPL